ncbi:MAG: tRNA lysidine(34) synthetase TilS [Leptospirillum sp.]
MNSRDKHPPDFRIFLEALRIFLERNRLSDATWRDFKAFVGVSGGADSTCLLYTLSMFPPIRNVLTILHFNHQTDPHRNKREEDFVKDQAVALGLPVIVGYREKDLPDCSEETLRRERYRFFNLHLDKTPHSILFLGHHLSDQSETILMNLFRNRGPRGLMGMQEFREGRYARPFLSLTSDEIRKGLQEQGIDYLRDPSNEDSRYLRNRIRNELAPLIREIFPPKGIDSLPALAEQMGRELTTEIKNIKNLPDHESRGTIIMSLSLFRFLSPVRQSLLLEDLWRHQSRWGLPIPPPGNILRSMNRNPPMTGPMGNGWYASIQSGRIRLYHSETGEDLDKILSPFYRFEPLDTKSNMDHNIKLPKGGIIRLEPSPSGETTNMWESGRKISRQCVLSQEELSGLVLGYPFLGAKIRSSVSGKPPKHLNRELLKSGLCRQDRSQTPVLYKNGEALWVPGVVPLPKSPLPQTGWGLKLTYFPWKEL